jgi:SpoVK/Ycf46/Vps4 family AAA+-type ATPase
MSEELIKSLQAAVAAAPTDAPLRRHLAGLLVSSGRAAEALEHLTHLLGADGTDDVALQLLAQVTRALGQPAAEPTGPSTAAPDFDWHSAESQVEDLLQPAFVTEEGDDPTVGEIERPTLRLEDVGGMQEVKDRLEAAFLAPMRNPDLRRLYGKSLRGGLLLYGPPGCGKTFLARAVAGELGAAFYAVSLADVLDMYIGQSERNLHDVFEVVRRNTPCVLFLDEIDAIGQKRSQLRHSAMRGTVNQLLTEMDDVGQKNEGVFVLGATNAPWDVDSALRRPGRLDRTLLVLPPDPPAREAILRFHLRERPVTGVNLQKLVRATQDFSGADLAHLCDSAAERALLDSAKSGEARMMEQRDFDEALRGIRPSIGPWLQGARNVAMFGNEGGEYDELLAYLKKRRLV